MCWDIDYKFFANQKKAQEARIKRDQRAGAIDQLLSEANKQGEKTNVDAACQRRLKSNSNWAPHTIEFEGLRSGEITTPPR